LVDASEANSSWEHKARSIFNLLSPVICGALFTSLSCPKSAAFKRLSFCKIPFERNHGFVLIIPPSYSPAHLLYVTVSPDLCYTLLFHLNCLVLLSLIVSLRWARPWQFIFCFYKQRGHGLLSMHNMAYKCLQKSPLGMCEFFFLKRHHLATVTTPGLLDPRYSNLCL
jgi:hypothetical protein